MDGNGLGGGSFPSARCETDSDCALEFCSGLRACAPDHPDADDDGCRTVRPTCEEGFDCDEERERCVPSCDDPDADQDGYEAEHCGGDDCDDDDADRFPGNTEVCDRYDHDEDCDPNTFGQRDVDGDGHVDARCCNVSDDDERSCGDDCDDDESTVHPEAPDTCNGVDEDCDGKIDEDGALAKLYPDCDGDGYGRLDAMAVTGCEPSEAPEECTNSSAQWSPVNTDCDDTRAAVAPDIGEICDGLDNDCNPDTFAVGEDDDGDKVADVLCGGTDCDDECSTCFPSEAAELCDGHDQDCDGNVDEGVPDVEKTMYYQDLDGDGYGNAAVTILSCEDKLEGYALTPGDCNDALKVTGVCAAPLSCLESKVCACQAEMFNNAEYLDLDAGGTAIPNPNSFSDIRIDNEILGALHLNTRNGRNWQRIVSESFVDVTLEDVDGVNGEAEDPNEWEPGEHGTVYIIRTDAGLYKLGYLERGVPLHFVYAPLGTPPEGFACQDLSLRN